MRLSILGRLVVLAALAAVGACGGAVELDSTGAPCPTPAPTDSAAPGASTTAMPPPSATTPPGTTAPPDGGGAPPSAGDYCVTAPWTNDPKQFATASGATNLPAGTYTMRYVGGAQIHDASEGYEVSAHYPIDGIEAGHHLYNGASPETSSTSIWLDNTGAGSQPSVAATEKANAGLSWSITTTGGPLYITYYDNDYSDNEGPGTQLCIDVAPAPAAHQPRVVFFGSPGDPHNEGSLDAFLEAYPATVTHDVETSSPITVDALGAYDVVILDHLQRTFGSDEANALSSWVSKGGSVISLDGFVDVDSDWQTPDTVLSAMPAHYDGTFVNGTYPCTGYATDFGSSPVAAGLSRVPFCGGWAVTTTGSCQSVATIDGTVVGATCDQGTGRVYLWGDEWVEYSSVWPGTDAQKFWQNAMDWLTHAK